MNTRTPVNHVIVGPADQVAQALATAQRTGRLVTCSTPRTTSDGRVIIDAQLLPTPRAARVHPYRPILLTTTIALVAGAVAALAWLAIALVTWIAAHLATILGATLTLLVLLGVLAGSGKCPGLHCPGCDG